MSDKVTGQNHPTISETKRFMDLLISGNYEEFRKNNKSGDFELFKIMLSGTRKMKYTLNNIRYNSEKSIINMTIKQPDLSRIGDKMAEKFEEEDINYDELTEEEKSRVIRRVLNKAIKEELEGDNLEYFIKTIDLIYIKKGEDWVREEINEDEFLDIFMSKLDRIK